MTHASQLRWRRSAGVMLCVAGHEAALLVRESWSAIQLDEVAREMWNALDEPKTTSELVEVLRQAYDVTPARCYADILPALHALCDAGALVVGEPDGLAP